MTETLHRARVEEPRVMRSKNGLHMIDVRRQHLPALTSAATVQTARRAFQSIAAVGMRGQP
jgi:hypothetical protein